MPTTSPTFTVVIPIFNKLALLRPSLEALFRAAERRPDVEVILVDNGSTDGSYELACAFRERATVHRTDGSISALRNWGARTGRGRYLSFVDSDVVIPDDYFDRLASAFSANLARAIGCEYHLPDAPALIERVWHELTVREDDGYRNYLNAGSFAITRELFERVGGFPEEFQTGEDTELCSRVRALGEPIYQFQALATRHLGNAKSLSAFYRRLLWHAGGITDGRRVILRHKPTLMMLLHASLTFAAVVLAAAPVSVSRGMRLTAATSLLLAVPMVTYLFRVRQVRRVVNLPVALFLIQIFYTARAVALVQVLTRLQRRTRGTDRPQSVATASRDA